MARWLRERSDETLQEYLEEAERDIEEASLKVSQRELQVRMAELRVRSAESDLASEIKYKEEIKAEIDRRAASGTGE